MMNIVLYQPQIAENTGNIIRLAANSGANLHLIRPYGFIWQNNKRKRAALDYADLVVMKHYNNFLDFTETCELSRCHLVTTKASHTYDKVRYEPGDYLIFGAETHGVGDEVRQRIKSQVLIPMQSGSRSINLANSVAIVLYEALRQQRFFGFL